MSALPHPRPRGRGAPRARRPALPAVVALALTFGCRGEPPPGADVPAEVTPGPVVGAPVVPSELSRVPAPSATAPAAPAPVATAADAGAPPVAEAYSGPYLIVTDGSAGVYADTSSSKKAKLGYLRSGSKVPVSTEIVAKTDECRRGWYRLRDGGFVCSSIGTTKVGSPEARGATRAPDWTSVLPYTYARNAKNGTPLYRSIPTVEQMREYEPYLVKKAEEPKAAEGGAKAAATPRPAPGAATPDATAVTPPKAATASSAAPTAAQGSPPPAEGTAAAAAPAVEGAGLAKASVAAAPPAEAPDAGPSKPWWQREDADERLHEVKLDELAADADGILAKRMVKGFYVAVDRELAWNGRPWYRTTKGLVAPADRFWITKASEFRGVELDGEKLALPLGFVTGGAKSRPRYELDATTGKLAPKGSLESRTAVALTGNERQVGGKKYLEAREGFWIQAAHLRLVQASPPPADLGPDERWVDVNLSTQTLVAFEGPRAVYATLVSSGKESKVKEKDHRTPTGEFRIREKHVTTTMDGDGSAAGDLPYSIEDVPYVMYFHKAYALHGAFWHGNYGNQMSHGCVNLSPLDAKWIFGFTGPHLPEGWHGVWASERDPGSRVLVHE